MERASNNAKLAAATSWQAEAATLLEGCGKRRLRFTLPKGEWAGVRSRARQVLILLVANSRRRFMDLVEWADRAAPAAFDYSSLDPAVASLARASASRIKEQMKKQHAVFLEIGREFLTVKDQLGHGDFGLWLDAEFGINERTAQRCIRAAELLGDKPNIASALPQIALVELAAPSTPEHVLETVVQRIAAGEQMRPMAVLAMVKAAREAEKKKKRTSAL